jgi:p-cumate 2,3-dioxygenase beta subunit
VRRLYRRERVVTAAETASPALISDIRRPEVEDLLYREARLLDEWRLDEWLQLYTDDARYVVPATDTPDGDPDRDLVLIDDDRGRMQSRVDRLNTRRAHREYPHSNTRHMVSNVELGQRGDNTLDVTAAFAVFRFRAERSHYYVGQYRIVLTVVDGRLRIKSKRVELDLTVLRPNFDVAIIL